MRHSSIFLLGIAGLISAVAADPPVPLRLKLSATAEKRSEVSELAIANLERRLTVRFVLKNTVAEECEFAISTAMIQTDGTVVRPNRSRGRQMVDGVVRTAIGVISLGLSEVASDPRVTNATLRTTHKLKPGEEIVIEHPSPIASPHVVGSYTFVDWVDPNSSHKTGINGTLRAETERYREEETRIRAEQAKHDVGGPEYKKWNDKFWEAHREHFWRREQIWEEHRQKRVQSAGKSDPAQ